MPSPMNHAEKAIFLDKRTIPGLGGSVTTQWVPGAEFDVLVSVAGTMEQLVAEQRGYTANFDITVDKDLNIDFHDVFKLKRDGRILRVTVDPDENHSPDMASFSVKVGQAERYQLPSS